MADKTRIEWTEATWNPVTGCTKVSAGCKNCYAERDWSRLAKNPATRYYGRDFTDVKCHGDVLNLPLHWKKPRQIFVNSMSDLFHPGVPDDFIDQVFAVMALAPQHTFQVLTKRPDRMLKHPIFSHSGSCLWVGIRHAAERLIGIDPGPMNKVLPNVWLGVSVEDQATANERIPLLLDTPAAVRWISAEPLLGRVDLGAEYLAMKCGGSYPFRGLSDEHRTKLIDLLDWVVVGGESGQNARPMHPDWARSLRDQCSTAGVPFLFKQWGEWGPASTLPPEISLPYKRWGWISENGGPVDKWHDRPFADESAHHELMARIGKTRAGRLLDGVLHDGYPGDSA